MKEIDLLNREEYIELLKTVLNTSNENNMRLTLALNGKWGSGKTFILNMLQEKIRDEWLVIKYDAWNSDFYNEPLISMMYCIVNELNALDTNSKIFEAIGSVIVKTTVDFLRGTIDVISNKLTGIKITKKITDEYKKVAKAFSGKNIDVTFNRNLDIEQTKNNIKKALAKLNEKVRILFLIDEIDRCLPTYALKVLERIHHFISEDDLCSIIVALDKEKLGKVVGGIYNDSDFDYNKYFQKIFNYTILVNEGSFNDKFDSKYYSYTSLFNNVIPYVSKEDVDLFKKELIDFGDIREYNLAVEKAFFVHKLLFSSDKKYDYSLQCVEILFSYFSILRKSNPDHLNRIFNSMVGMKNKNTSRIYERQSFIRLTTKILESYSNNSNYGIIFRHKNLWSLLFYYIIKCYEFFKNMIIFNDPYFDIYEKYGFDYLKVVSEYYKKIDIL